MLKLYKFFLVLVTFLPILSVVLFNKLGSSLFLYINSLKDMFLLFLLTLAVLFYMMSAKVSIDRGLAKIYLFIIVFVCINIASAAISPADFEDKLFNLRRNISLLLVFTVFSLIPLKSIHLKIITKFLIVITCLVVGFGFFEYAQPDSFWNKTINIPNYWLSSELDPFGTQDIASSGRFYSWDLLFITGSKIRRLVSLYTEPTTLSAFLIFTLTFFILNRYNFYAKKLFLSLVFITGFLTVSKAFVLALLVLLVNRVFRIITLKWLMIFMVIFYLAGFELGRIGLTTGPFSHIYDFYSGVNGVLLGNYFGAGIGVAGIYGTDQAIMQIVGGGESGFGNMLAQLGIGALLFPYIVFLILRMLRKQFQATHNHHYLALFACLFIWFLVYLYSASSLGFSGNVFFFMFAGLWLNSLVLKEIRNEKKDIIPHPPTAISTS